MSLLYHISVNFSTDLAFSLFPLTQILRADGFSVSPRSVVALFISQLLLHGKIDFPYVKVASIPLVHSAEKIFQRFP